MARLELSAHSGLVGTARPGRYGARADTAPGVVLTERSDLAIAHVAARAGKTEDAIARLAVLAGSAPADGPSCTIGAGVAVLGCAPGQWLVVLERRSGAIARATGTLAEVASVVDISAGKVVIRVRGPKVRETLAKGCPIDLDAGIFGAGSAAATEIAHMGCQLWLVDTQPTFDLMVNRSLAKSFWSWISASAAEHGYEVA